MTTIGKDISALVKKNPPLAKRSISSAVKMSVPMWIMAFTGPSVLPSASRARAVVKALRSSGGATFKPDMFAFLIPSKAKDLFPSISVAADFVTCAHNLGRNLGVLFERDGASEEG